MPCLESPQLGPWLQQISILTQEQLYQAQIQTKELLPEYHLRVRLTKSQQLYYALMAQLSLLRKTLADENFILIGGQQRCVHKICRLIQQFYAEVQPIFVEYHNEHAAHQRYFYLEAGRVELYYNQHLSFRRQLRRFLQTKNLSVARRFFDTIPIYNWKRSCLWRMPNGYFAPTATPCRRIAQRANEILRWTRYADKILTTTGQRLARPNFYRPML